MIVCHLNDLMSNARKCMVIEIEIEKKIVFNMRAGKPLVPWLLLRRRRSLRKPLGLQCGTHHMLFNFLIETSTCSDLNFYLLQGR